MTQLLEKVFAKAGKLPEVEQNALAKWLLKELVLLIRMTYDFTYDTALS